MSINLQRGNMDCVFTRLSQCRALVVTISVSITTGDCSTGDGSFRKRKKTQDIGLPSDPTDGYLLWMWRKLIPPVWDHLSKFIHWDQNLRVEETSTPKVLSLAILYHYVAPSRAWNLCFKRTNCVAVVHVIIDFTYSHMVTKAHRTAFIEGLLAQCMYIHECTREENWDWVYTLTRSFSYAGNVSIVDSRWP
jgi:hypothetical protein